MKSLRILMVVLVSGCAFMEPVPEQQAAANSPYVCKKVKATGSHRVEEVCEIRGQSEETKRNNEEFMKRNTHTVPQDRARMQN